MDDGLWGVDAEIGYDFHRSGRWALGVGLGVSFYEDADAFRLAGRCHERRQSKTTAEVSVDTSSEISENAFLTDPYYAGAADELRNADGSYGAGTFDGHSNPYGGGNPILSVSGIDSEKTTDTATRTTTRTTTATSSLAVDLASEGTVSTWEMRLALQPSYRVTDWCEVRGTFGAVMTHVDVDVDSAVFVNGGMYHRISTCDDGHVFAGLCGLDAVFSPCEWLDILVGADLRIGPNKWDFDTGLARGTAELPRATCRAGVGVRF